MTDENDDTTVLNQNRNMEQDSYRKLVAYHIPHLLTAHLHTTYIFRACALHFIASVRACATVIRKFFALSQLSHNRDIFLYIVYGKLYSISLSMNF